MPTQVPHTLNLRRTLSDIEWGRYKYPPKWVYFHFALMLVLYGTITLLSLQTNNVFFLFVLCLFHGTVAEALSIINHEILHGAFLKNKTIARTSSLFISTISLISPSYWRMWHNHHHRVSDRWTEKRQKFLVGPEIDGYPELTGKLSWAELFIYKTYHTTMGQFRFLFSLKFKNNRFLRLQNRVRNEVLFIFLVKIFLFYYLPLKHWVFLELLSLLVQNFWSSIFLRTQHTNLFPYKNSAGIPTHSVTMARPLNLLFLHTGLHFEHHLLPNVSSAHLEEIRQKLNLDGKIQTEVVPLFSVLKSVFSGGRH